MSRRNKAVFIIGLLFLATLMAHLAATAKPVAIFTHSPEAPIINQIVVFNASDSYDPDPGGYIISYEWNFGDGSSPITIADPITFYNYTAYGTYNVTLTVTDNEGLADTTWDILTVRKHPVANFTYSPPVPLVNTTVTFNASLSTPNGGTIVNYTWNFGDSTPNVTETDPIATHAYLMQGNYTVTLAITDSEELTDTCSKSIKVIKCPVANFTYWPKRPLIGETVTFNASLSTPNGGTIVNYTWNFGDSTPNVTETDPITTHIYTTYGTYNATLTITDSEGLTDTAWGILTIRKHPVAIFTYSPPLPLVNTTVTFNASLSTPDGGTIVSYAWNFGDGNTGTGMIVNHTYTAYGTYNVTLTVTDSEDLSDTCFHLVKVPRPPIANFTYSPASPVVNETITFNASASYDLDGTVVSYRWDFGDGNVTTVTDPLINHTYTTAGIYNITLTVTDSDSLTNTIRKPAAVYSFLYIHDVAIVSVIPSAAWVWGGRTINITVAAKNNGTSVETFTVTVYYDNTVIGTKTVTNLLPNEETTLIFIWDTTSLPKGPYTVSANASIVPGETRTADNTHVYGTIMVTFHGDANGDGKVNVIDLGQLGYSWLTEVGDPKFDSRVDFNMDGKINVLDLGTIGFWWLHEV